MKTAISDDLRMYVDVQSLSVLNPDVGSFILPDSVKTLDRFYFDRPTLTPSFNISGKSGYNYKDGEIYGSDDLTADYFLAEILKPLGLENQIIDIRNNKDKYVHFRLNKDSVEEKILQFDDAKKLNDARTQREKLIFISGLSAVGLLAVYFLTKKSKKRGRK